MNTFAVVAGLLSLLVLILTAWLLHQFERSKRKKEPRPWWKTWVRSAMVAAVAFQFMGISLYSWVPLYGTIWLIAIAMGVRMLAYCTRTMNASSIQIHFELDEVARTSGVSQLMSFRWIFIPIMMPAIFYSALMVGMLAARDLTLPLVMNTGKQQVVSVLIFDLQTNGDQNAAAAVSLYMIVVLVLLALFARRATGMQETGIHRQRSRRSLLVLPRFNGRRSTPRLVE